MNRLPVKSSNIKSVGFDQINFILEIEFHSGGIYRCFQVPTSEYQGLIYAPSIGTYFDRHIKDKYRFEKIK